MRVLVMPSPDMTMSSITRCLSVVEALSEDSHQVAAVCTNTSRFWFEAIGVMVFSRPEPVFESVLADGIIPVHNLADYVELVGLGTPTFVEESVKAEVKAIRIFKPDIALCDFNLTASISTQLCGLPLASTAHSPFHPEFTAPLFKPPKAPKRWMEPFNRILQSRSIKPIQALEELYFLRSEIKLCTSVPELEPFLVNVPGIHFVGPLLSKSLEQQRVPEWIEELDQSRPVVFVYLSVGDILPPEMIDVVPRAFDNTEFQVIVSFGHHPGVSTLPSPTTNVRFEEFVPGAAMLKRSDIFIFHGGQNTTVNAIQNEVPSMIFPCLVFERDFNARMAESVGAGVRLEHSEFTPSRLRETARQLIQRGFSKRARAVAARLRSLGGASYVVQILASYYDSM